MAHRQWMPVARALWYSLKATHLMHIQGCCLGGNAGQNWMWAPVYITNPITQAFLASINDIGRLFQSLIVFG